MLWLLWIGFVGKIYRKAIFLFFKDFPLNQSIAMEAGSLFFFDWVHEYWKNLVGALEPWTFI